MTGTCKGCPTCLADDRRNANIERVRAAAVVLICENCGCPSDTTVGKVLGGHFRFVCCTKKRKKK